MISAVGYVPDGSVLPSTGSTRVRPAGGAARAKIQIGVGASS